MVAKKFSTLTAPNSQALTQAEQPMQAVLQFFLAIPPFWVLLQGTTAAFLSGTILITCLGQLFDHSPQPVQWFTSTLATPFSTEIAPNSQTFTQSPRPRQPKSQDFIPPPRATAALQEDIPV